MARGRRRRNVSWLRRDKFRLYGLASLPAQSVDGGQTKERAMISEREKAFFLQGVMLVRELVDRDIVDTIEELAAQLQAALGITDQVLLDNLIEIAEELYDALQAGGFEGESVTRRVQ